MEVLRQHLDIIFSQVQPEAVYDNIIEHQRRFHINAPALSSWSVKCESYCHFAHEVLQNLTPDESENMYADMHKHMEQRGKDCGGENVFALLVDYTIHTLIEQNGVPYCRQEKALNWRACYMRIGQDILVTAYLAYQKLHRGIGVKSFCWPAQIHTNDIRLNRILENGIAENHFHLNGSARVFDISWLCLMNHPERIREYFGRGKFDSYDMPADKKNILFRENLSGSIMFGEQDNHWSWEKRLYIACWIRATIFGWMQKGPNEDIDGIKYLGMLRRYPLIFFKQETDNKIQTIRFMYSGQASFMQQERRYSCLDYAVALDSILDDRNNEYRILSGERAFLYTAFLWIFSGKIEAEEKRHEFMDLFYLYLLLKNQFRSEVIQANGRIGFKNFAYYENRKDVLFDIYPDYQLEAYNTSVATAIGKEHVAPHELRITPKDNPNAIYDRIWGLDQSIDFLLGKEEKWRSREDLKRKRLDADYFYTIHFIKHPDSLGKKEKWYALERPRNYEVRKDSRKKTLALAKALEDYNYLSARIRGIDACNFEIGCRPETFASEFRFLREFVPFSGINTVRNTGKLVPRLAVTYHAGEDFLDLADGMRAVDEAMKYLELRRDDRIGHAIAVGLSPDIYYAKKKRRLVIPKQVRLDDIIWLIFRSKELGVSVDPLLLQKLKDEAVRLIDYVFDGESSGMISLNNYYDSMQIRGDDPELYRYLRYAGLKLPKWIEYVSVASIMAQYEYHRILRHGYPNNLDIYRRNPKVCELYAAYHFDFEVKMRGFETTEVLIEPAYIKLIKQMQDKMQQEIASKGIGVECNPSSNILIAPIDRYIDHPVFRFIPVRNDMGHNISIYASVNTDDQGVFDTSLGNEYALLACALSLEKDDEGHPQYSDDEIYDYLERLQKNGKTQVFPKAELVGNGGRGGSFPKRFMDIDIPYTLLSLDR